MQKNLNLSKISCIPVAGALLQVWDQDLHPRIAELEQGVGVSFIFFFPFFFLFFSPPSENSAVDCSSVFVLSGQHLEISNKYLSKSPI